METSWVKRWYSKSQYFPVLWGRKLGALNREKIDAREVVPVFCLGSGHLWTFESEMVGLPTPHPSCRDEVTLNITPPTYRGSLTPPPWEKILPSGFCDSQVLPQQPVRVSSTKRYFCCSMVMFWWYLYRLIMFLVVKVISDQYGS